MSEYFNRSWRLLVNNETLTESKNDGISLRTVFSVVIDYGGANSYADIAIYNLSRDTAAKLRRKGTKIQLDAGYDSKRAAIFSGAVSNALYSRDGPNLVARLLCKGGSQPPAKINTTFGAHAPVVELIRGVASAMGYPVVINEPDFSNAQRTERPYSMSGGAKDYLDKLATAHDFSYVIQNESIIINKNGSNTGEQTKIIKMQNGMVDIPTITDAGIDVYVLLNPDLKIFNKFRVESEFRSFNFGGIYYREIPENYGRGDHVIYKLVHSGDTHGDAWQTEITGFRSSV